MCQVHLKSCWTFCQPAQTQYKTHFWFFFCQIINVFFVARWRATAAGRSPVGRWLSVAAASPGFTSSAPSWPGKGSRKLGFAKSARRWRAKGNWPTENWAPRKALKKRRTTRRRKRRLSTLMLKRFPVAGNGSWRVAGRRFRWERRVQRVAVFPANPSFQRPRDVIRNFARRP